MQLPESEYCESSSRRGIDEVRYVSGLFKSPCTSPACQDEQGMSRTAISLRQVDSGVPGPPALFFLFESHLPGDRHSSLGECTRRGEQVLSKQGRSSFAKKAATCKAVPWSVAHARHAANAGSFIRLASTRTCPIGLPKQGASREIRGGCVWRWRTWVEQTLQRVLGSGALAPQEVESVT